jgi:lipopolysaccharide transport system ATP-binding protein
MPNKLIELSQVGIFYSQKGGFLKNRKFWALKNLSLEIYRGETIGIIGHNGAGKSTLLKVLAGMISPSIGRYHNPGYSVAMLSLSVGFAAHLTGKENAILSGMLLGISKKEIIGKLKTIEKFSELGDFFNQPVKTYSTGMRTRLGFSVAIQVDPDILLIDEVLGVGDELFRKKSSSALRNRIKSNKTVVIVSHNINTIRRLCDRVILMHKGEIVSAGQPSKVINYYRKFNIKSYDKC